MSLAEVERPPKQRDPVAALRISKAAPLRPSRRGRRWLVRLFVLGILAGVVVGGLYVAHVKGMFNVQEVVEALQPRVEVRVAAVSVQTGRAGDAVVVATGYLESRQQAKIGARAPGRIQSLNVEEGSTVKEGELIAELEHDDLDAALAAARASVERANAEVAEQQVEIARTKREFERLQKLRPSHAVTESEFDEARFLYEGAVAKLKSLQAAVTLAEARVREAEQVKANMFVRAPFDGTVISKDAELGESILPGGMGEASGRGSVVTIADLDHLEVDCDVKEDYISRVEVGQPAEVAVDAVPDRRYEGRVRKIIPMGDRARATIKVKVEIVDSDGRLFPEMSSTVYFLPDKSELPEETTERRIFCPSEAVVTEGERIFVWLVDDEDRLQQVDVETGEANNGQTEILGGLSGGERVVMRPPANLKTSQLVKVSE
jgi:RND family efflux transporter MFP subunit